MSYVVPQTAKVADKEVTWQEQRQVVRSETHARQQQQALDNKAAKAVTALQELNERKQGKKRLDAQELAAASERIAKRYGIAALVDIQVVTATTEVAQRKYKDRPAGIQVVEEYTVKVKRSEERTDGLVDGGDLRGQIERGQQTQCSNDGGGGERIAGKSASGEHLLAQRILFVDDHARHGKTITQSFADEHDVRHQAELGKVKARPGTVKAGQHLVEDQQDVVGRAKAGNLLIEVW